MFLYAWRSLCQIVWLKSFSVFLLWLAIFYNFNEERCLSPNNRIRTSTKNEVIDDSGFWCLEIKWLSASMLHYHFSLLGYVCNSTVLWSDWSPNTLRNLLQRVKINCCALWPFLLPKPHPADIMKSKFGLRCLNLSSSKEVLKCLGFFKGPTFHQGQIERANLDFLRHDTCGISII